MESLTSGELIEALKAGKLLVQINKFEFAEDELLYFFYHHKMFEMKGWGSAVTKKEWLIEDIMLNPENWSISQYKVEDYPWSCNFKKTQNG
jgi:hypothetical protein